MRKWDKTFLQPRLRNISIKVGGSQGYVHTSGIDRTDLRSRSTLQEYILGHMVDPAGEKYAFDKSNIFEKAPFLLDDLHPPFHFPSTNIHRMVLCARWIGNGDSFSQSRRGLAFSFCRAKRVFLYPPSQHLHCSTPCASQAQWLNEIYPKLTNGLAPMEITSVLATCFTFLPAGFMQQ